MPLLAGGCCWQLPSTADLAPPAHGPPLQVLSRANHSSSDMLARVGAAVAAAVGRGDMPAATADRLLAAYTERMSG